MPDEKKPDEKNPSPPVGGEGQNPPVSNQGPSAEELQKQNEELQKQIKERDAQIADLNTTEATIEARQEQIKKQSGSVGNNKAIEEKTRRILGNAAFDPDGAARELSELLSDVSNRTAQEAVLRAQQSIQATTTIEKLKSKVRSENPDFDDEIVDVVMDRADGLARSGKYKTADEAVIAATQYIKTKLEAYASKRNASPPLPEGARAEGASPKPPEVKREEPLPTAEQEIEARRMGLQKKIL